ALAVRHDHLRLGIVIVDDLAARAARRHHCDGAVLLIRLGMAHRDDALDALVARLGDGAADRHRFGAHRHAAEIRVDVDAGDDAAVAVAQRGAAPLPLVAIAALDGVARRRDQLAILGGEARPLHRASSLRAARISRAVSAPSPAAWVAAATAAAACGWP